MRQRETNQPRICSGLAVRSVLRNACGSLLGLFSLVTVWANRMVRSPVGDPTFSDAIAAVRRALWYPPDLCMSRQTKEIIEIPATLLQRLTETLCHAA